MPVVIGVASEGDIEAALFADEALHRERRRGIHADAAVPVQAHEAEGRVDFLAGHRQVDSVMLRDAAPVMHAGTAERIGAHANAGGADRIHVDDIGQIGDIGAEVIVQVRARGCESALEGHPRHAFQAGANEIVGLALDPAGDAGIRGPAVRRVVLEAAILRRIVRRRHDDAVGEALLATFVVGKNRMRHRGGRRVFACGRDHDVHAIGREDFQCAAEGRLRQRMGIDADEKGPVDACRGAIQADRLGDGQHMRLVERGRERRTAVA